MIYTLSLREGIVTAHHQLSARLSGSMLSIIVRSRVRFMGCIGRQVLSDKTTSYRLGIMQFIVLGFYARPGEVTYQYCFHLLTGAKIFPVSSASAAAAAANRPAASQLPGAAIALPLRPSAAPAPASAANMAMVSPVAIFFLLSHSSFLHAPSWFFLSGILLYVSLHLLSSLVPLHACLLSLSHPLIIICGHRAAPAANMAMI